MVQRMPLLVTNADQVRENHQTYWTNMSKPKPSTALVDVIPYIQAWLAFRADDGTWQFSPSKFVGYNRITVVAYDEHHKSLDGRQTERVMAPWLRPLNPLDITEAREALFDFCGQFGKRPNGRFRIATLSDQSGPAVADRDEAMVKLIVDLSKLLPRDKQQEVARLLK
jgi:hypothetical protein